jgi:hypothetical protein
MSLAHIYKENDTVTPPAGPSNEARALEPFEGRPVIGSKVAITKAGDGLSDALSVDPGAFDLGAQVYVVLKCDVQKVRYSEVKDTDSLIREHTFAAEAATIVDAELVADLVAQQVEYTRKRKEEAAGIQSLDFEQPTEHPAIPLLEKLRKDRLQEIATENGVTFKAKATSKDLIGLLCDQVTDIYAVAEAALALDRPDDEATVTPIGQAAKATEADEWES